MTFRDRLKSIFGSTPSPQPASAGTTPSPKPVAFPGITSVGPGAFSGGNASGSVGGGGAVSVPADVFKSATFLTSLHIPDGITGIGTDAFKMAGDELSPADQMRQKAREFAEEHKNDGVEVVGMRLPDDSGVGGSGNTDKGSSEISR